MIHKIETVNNLHTSYKLSRWKVLTKGLTKTVSISLHQYWAYDENRTATSWLCMLYSIENIKISSFVIRETATIEYLFQKTIETHLENGTALIALV